MEIINKHLTYKDYSEESFSKKKLKILREMKYVMDFLKSRQQIATSWGKLKPKKLTDHLKSLLIYNLKVNLKKLSKITLSKRDLKNAFRVFFQPLLTKMKKSHERDVRPGRTWEYSHLIEHLNITRPSIILDAGGASTPIVFYLGYLKNKVYTIDLSKELVDNSNKASKIMGWDIIAKQADLTNIPFEDNFFDYIISVSVLEHMSNALKIKGMKEFERVLKPGGLIGLTIDYGESNDNYKNHVPLKSIEEIYEILIKPTNLNVYGNQKLLEDRQRMKFFGKGYTLYALFLQKIKD
ncbi:MAG: class I SAM-dependent methyltransferase [Promethearchaeota archaeon]